MRLRISIRGLFALILLIAFALAALRASTLGWAAVSILLALLTLCTASLGAMTRGGPRRAPWLGFAIFGWAYFLLHFSPVAQWKTGYGPARFTTWAIDRLILPHVSPELEVGIAIGGLEEFVMLNSGRSGSFFCAVVHSLGSIGFGLIGVLAGLFVGRDDDPPGPESRNRVE